MEPIFILDTIFSGNVFLCHSSHWSCDDTAF